MIHTSQTSHFFEDLKSPAYDIIQVPMMDRGITNVVFTVKGGPGNSDTARLGVEFGDFDQRSMERVEQVAHALKLAYIHGEGIAVGTLDGYHRMVDELMAVVKDEEITTAAKVTKIERILNRES